MTVTTPTPADPHVAVGDDLSRLGLTPHIAELEMDGFTVIPPEKVGGDVTALRRAAARVVSDVHGVDVDGDGTELSTDPRGMDLNFMVLRGEEFERAVLNETVLAMASYLVGASCKLWLSSLLVKTKTSPVLPIHGDNPPAMPEPWPLHPQVCNCTYVLSEYDAPGGATSFVRGSHRFGRRPTKAEALDFERDDLVTASAPIGSLIVWPGNMWHGAMPRRVPGVRLSLTLAFSRPYIQMQQDCRAHVTEDVLERNSPRLRTLLGLDDPVPYTPDGFHPRYASPVVPRAGAGSYFA